ncbi:MAG: AAA family ATPase [Candidatus Sumerlaeota bacterium]|nr:AAA family ATPase [Candidatus Sumerlaeota bacterium]
MPISRTRAEKKLLIKSLQIRNLLSFGADTPPLELGPLSVFIGINGSGKTNFLETIGLLKAAPDFFSAPVNEFDGVREWLHKPFESARNGKPVKAQIEAIIHCPKSADDLRHVLAFTEHGRRFEIIDERIEYAHKKQEGKEAYFFYKFMRGHPVLNEMVRSKETKRKLSRESIPPEQSILSQFKDPVRYPELNFLSDSYRRIALFRDWVFGRYAPPRIGQRVGMPNDYLTDTCDNLALVLADILPEIKQEFLEELNHLYPGITDIIFKPSGHQLQLYLQEGARLIPATRLSDGTVRYLCILTALLHPVAPPLVCLDEPDAGLHPDMFPALADLLRRASERMQIILTTHSDLLVDAFHETPQCIVTFDRAEGSTVMQRLDPEALKEWLKRYSLGQLWHKGKLGGTRY